jgi:hypothetical protein
VLREAGLKVALVDGWETRGNGDVGQIQGIICHHTAGPRSGNMPSLRTVTNGRPDLPGPLSQLGLGRDGTYYVIAAGRCSHAGRGHWHGVTAGNTSLIGIEAENTGASNDFPWPEVQVDAYQRGVAAILKKIGKSAEFCCGHKEYALPAGRKPDPTFDMESFRSVVASILNGTAPPPRTIPAAEPAAQPNGQPGRPTLRRGAQGEHVKQLQEKLNRLIGGLDLPVNGSFGPLTEAAVRAFQREHGMVPDGIIGPKSWVKLDTPG